MRACTTPGCKRERNAKSSKCGPCRVQRRKDLDECKYVYTKLRGNARRRGKVFTISLLYFRLWCWSTGYLEKRGRTKDDATIDRIDNAKGYERGNIAILSVSENARKGSKDPDDWPGGMMPDFLTGANAAEAPF